jgi:magnesium chelatase family protein
MDSGACGDIGRAAHAYHRILRVARTIADLAHAERIGEAHVSEAVQYRRALRDR